ncbi:MAG: GNAT family N-acetyltransferase [Candidatus Eremiobacteraeota bacterium]|nr:GNAT family N-acetyltransferase [Candidatus Eremiobacteraeota bacterium]
MAPDIATGVREARDEDAPRVLEIIGAAFAQYEGCVLELTEVPELLRPASYVRPSGGRFWVATRQDDVVGFAVLGISDEPETVELKKLYAHPRLHGTGVGRVLLTRFEAEARALGARRICLWTDTRFLRAHGFYERYGYVRLGQTRELHDASNSVEYNYQKVLS